MSSQIVREVMRDYEKDRDRAARLRAERKERLYAGAPRLREIDERLAGLGLSLAKGMLADGGQGLADALSAECAALTAERDDILKRLDLPVDSAGHICAACRDTGFADGRRCVCFKQRLTEKFRQFSGLDAVLKRENFDTFDMGLYSNEADPKTGVSPRAVMSKHWSRALQFVKRFDTDHDNLLFYGGTGLGKTFLCNCIARDLLDTGRSVVYSTSPQLFKAVERARFDKPDDGGETDAFLSLLTEADLLIIDDLGTEVSTVVTASELFNIINSRLLTRRSTIISTNYDIAEINNRYSDRITSRLFGNFAVCRFAGEDLRVKIRYKM